MSVADEGPGSERGSERARRWLRAGLSLAAGAAAGLANIVVPARCLACQHPLGSHDALCAACWRKVRFIRAPLCDRLGIPLPFDTGAPTVSAAALADPPDWDRARAVAHFGPVVRDLIHGFKYSDRHDARRLFGRWLAVAGAELLADADALVPVPLHRWRLMHRKYNQAGLLTQEVAKLTAIEELPHTLQRRKATPRQVGQSATERRRNLSGAFVVAPADVARIDGRRIVLIDDVMTTGSTAAACARALRRAGAARVDVLAIALVTEDSRIGN